MALAPITAAADPVGQADFATKMGTAVGYDQAVYDATKAFGTAVSTWCAAATAAIERCMSSHPQEKSIAVLQAANTALKTAADALVTATTT